MTCVNGDEHACTQTEAEANIPPTVPLERGQEGYLDFQQTKTFLHDLFRREKRHWSAEEDQLLLQVTPISEEDAALIRIWFTLPSSHLVFQQTKRKQELTTFLRDFNGELDKIRRFAHLIRPRASEHEEEPKLWREVLKWTYDDPTVRLPATFWELPDDVRQKYFDKLEAFRKEVQPPA